jgi:predicted small lipoprotein YifL
MTRLMPLAAVLTLLAACGADGPPRAPATAVAAGVTVGSGGVQPSAAIARTSGNVTLGVGIGN